MAGAAAGRGFFASALAGFFAGAAIGFFAGVTAGFLYGTVLVWADVVGFFADGVALEPVTGVFLVPMGCGAILNEDNRVVYRECGVLNILDSSRESCSSRDIESCRNVPHGKLDIGGAQVALADDVRTVRTAPLPNAIKVAVALETSLQDPGAVDVERRSARWLLFSLTSPCCAFGRFIRPTSTFYPRLMPETLFSLG